MHMWNLKRKRETMKQTYCTPEANVTINHTGSKIKTLKN